jgi:hypothetical protein
MGYRGAGRGAEADVADLLGQGQRLLAHQQCPSGIAREQMSDGHVRPHVGEPLPIAEPGGQGLGLAQDPLDARQLGELEQ